MAEAVASNGDDILRSFKWNYANSGYSIYSNVLESLLNIASFQTLSTTSTKTLEECKEYEWLNVCTGRKLVYRHILRNEYDNKSGLKIYFDYAYLVLTSPDVTPDKLNINLSTEL